MQRSFELLEKQLHEYITLLKGNKQHSHVFDLFIGKMESLNLNRINQNQNETI